MDGQVVHHGKYGYGVTWRTDKFGRQSVRFQSGKEVNGFAPVDLRVVDSEEFKNEKVLEQLKSVGLADHINQGSESKTVEALIDQNERNSKMFKEMFEKTKARLGENVDTKEVAKEVIAIVENTDVDAYTKRDVTKRLSRIDEAEKLLNYVGSSYERFQKIDENQAIIKLNLELSKLIECLSEE